MKTFDISFFAHDQLSGSSGSSDGCGISTVVPSFVVLSWEASELAESELSEPRAEARLLLDDVLAAGLELAVARVPLRHLLARGLGGLGRKVVHAGLIAGMAWNPEEVLGIATGGVYPLYAIQELSGNQAPWSLETHLVSGAGHEGTLHAFGDACRQNHVPRVRFALEGSPPSLVVLFGGQMRREDEPSAHGCAFLAANLVTIDDQTGADTLMATHRVPDAAIVSGCRWGWRSILPGMSVARVPKMADRRIPSFSR